MGNLEAILAEVRKLNEKIDALPALLEIRGPQIVIGSMDELSPNLGLIMAGEFRAGNNRTPGDSFSGMRMRFPPMAYPDTSTSASDLYNLAGVDADTLMFGVRASDGVAIWGGGLGEMDLDGLKLIDTDGTPAFHALAQAATINSEALGAGDVLIGDNSATKPNILFDRSDGSLKFRHGTIVVGEMKSSEGGLGLYGARVRFEGTEDSSGLPGFDIDPDTGGMIPFEKADYDDAGFWDSDDPTDFRIPAGQAGTYQLGAVVRIMGGNNAGQMFVNLIHEFASDTTELNKIVSQTVGNYSTGTTYTYNLVGETYMSSGDVAYMYVAPDTAIGGLIYTLCLPSTNPSYPSMWIRRVR